MTRDSIAAACRERGLAIVGAFHPDPQDLPPEGTATLFLLGADGPEMWAHFSASPEFCDGAKHPMDRWSRRVISALARDLGAGAFFPFGGPPYAPFQRWAIRAEGARSSPVAMQVTGARGLWTSYRGALAFGARVDLPGTPFHDPCRRCPAPCLSACPVDAFDAGRYDVPACTAHVRQAAGTECRTGCLVRRACPAGESLALSDAQKSFHMAAFLAAQP
ncbi:MAG: ferredoxin [Pseudomonadota bacterium]